MKTKFEGAAVAVVAADQRVLATDRFLESAGPGRAGRSAKRIFDVTFVVLALPVLAIAALVLACANPIWNPGPLLYRQTRMGKDCRPFTAYKFRSMRGGGTVSARGPADPLERDRITPLGRYIRRIRLDELPQFINILKGDMSLIGPRPDYWDHAIHYIERVPGYRERHVVLPGITGLAQVNMGYAEGFEDTFRKVRYDLDYIHGASLRLEAHVFWRTLVVLSTGFGAR